MTDKIASFVVGVLFAFLLTAHPVAFMVGAILFSVFRKSYTLLLFAVLYDLAFFQDSQYTIFGVTVPVSALLLASMLFFEFVRKRYMW